MSCTHAPASVPKTCINRVITDSTPACAAEGLFTCALCRCAVLLEHIRVASNASFPSPPFRNKKISKANKSRTLLRYSITYHHDLIFYQLAMQTKRIAVYVVTSTRLPYLDVRCTVRASKWIPRQTADFIQDPHPRPYQYALLEPLLVLVRNEFYLSCLRVYFV